MFFWGPKGPFAQVFYSVKVFFSDYFYHLLKAISYGPAKGYFMKLSLMYVTVVTLHVIQRSRMTFNKLLVSFRLILQRRTSSYEKFKEDRREKIRAHSFDKH
jgi:hypothetical protein